jgi:quinol monooxygenase YgiN
MNKNHQMINAIYIFKTDRKSAKGLADLLNKVIERVKYVPGCQQSEIWQKKDLSELMLFETWITMADLKNHINSPIYKWMLAAIDMSTGEPCIRFAECENIRGIDMIERILTEGELTSLPDA